MNGNGIPLFGSVLVTTHSAGGRALSVLPPHHVVIARREQLLPDLTAAFEHLQAEISQLVQEFELRSELLLDVPRGAVSVE